MRVDTVEKRASILLVVTQEEGVMPQYGLPEQDVTFLEALGLKPGQMRVVNAVTGILPSTIEASGVVFTGSRHNAYDDHPWNQRLKEFIRAIAQKETPTLGICYGHQVIAEALGGKVEKGSKGREMGVTKIELTETGRLDPLFRDLPERFELATSHADVVTVLPDRDGMEILANNIVYPYQALAWGPNIRTIQPHPEMTGEAVAKIATARQELLVAEGITTDAEFAAFIAGIQQSGVESNGRQVLQNFMRFFVYPNSR